MMDSAMQAAKSAISVMWIPRNMEGREIRSSIFFTMRSIVNPIIRPLKARKVRPKIRGILFAFSRKRGSIKADATKMPAQQINIVLFISNCRVGVHIETLRITVITNNTNSIMEYQRILSKFGLSSVVSSLTPFLIDML